MTLLIRTFHCTMYLNLFACIAARSGIWQNIKIKQQFLLFSLVSRIHAIILWAVVDVPISFIR